MQNVQGTAGHEKAGNIERGDEQQAKRAEPEEEAIARARLQLDQPGALRHAEATQLHRADNILGANDRANYHRNEHGSEARYFAEQAAAQLVNLEAARTLGIERGLKIAHGGRKKTEGELDGIRDFIAQAHLAKGHAKLAGIGG